MNWASPSKPTEHAENRLIDAILDGHLPIGTYLPGERDLAAQLGVTRPTLREALQRLRRDGWIEIRQGHPTRVRDFWREGNLGVLGAVARRKDHIPDEFIPNLLKVRRLLAPEYTRLAVERDPARVLSELSAAAGLPDDPSAFAAFDWQLHHTLTTASGNPVFTLILNGFRDLYLPMAGLYFQSPEARASSRGFYTALEGAIQTGDLHSAETITRQVMFESLNLWMELG